MILKYPSSLTEILHAGAAGVHYLKVGLKLRLGNVIFIHASLTNLVALTCNQQD